MLLYILFFSMIALLVGIWFLFKKDIIEPAVLLTVSYVLSIFCVVLNINKWGVDLTNTTFSVILFGTIEFCIISYGISQFFKRKNKRKV